MRKIKGSDAGQLYAMKVLKKATLKGEDWDSACSLCFCATLSFACFVFFFCIAAVSWYIRVHKYVYATLQNSSSKMLLQ